MKDEILKFAYLAVDGATKGGNRRRFCEILYFSLIKTINLFKNVLLFIYNMY